MEFLTSLDKYHLEVVPYDDPTVNAWYKKMQARYNAIDFIRTTPAIWFGLYEGTELVAAYGGFADSVTGTLIVTAAVCEPSKRGAVALPALGMSLYKMTEKHRIVFYVSATNRRMLRYARTVFGAKPIAQLLEIDNRWAAAAT